MVKGILLLDPLSANDNRYKELLTTEEQKKSGFDKTANLIIMKRMAQFHLGFIIKAIMKKAPPFYYYDGFSNDAAEYILSSIIKPSLYTAALEEYRLSHEEKEIVSLKEKYDFNELVEIMKTLRSENGCPWDREQSHESLKRYLIEETYEVLETIDANDKKALCDELGDVLLQVVFHSEIARSEGTFDINDVITGICQKMIIRHPHVFGEGKADTPDEVLENWEAIKKKEKKLKSQTGVLKDVPSNLPALMRSYKVQQKAAQVGFDWDDIDDAFSKVDEEIQELRDVYKSNNVERITDELGDAFFALVNVSRFLKIQPELALSGTIGKFIRRFEYIEQQSTKAGKKLEDMSLAEMDELWNEAKHKLPQK
jgi:tetrapyrrole methylase family protein/MazG family protein